MTAQTEAPTGPGAPTGTVSTSYYELLRRVEGWHGDIELASIRGVATEHKLFLCVEGDGGWPNRLIYIVAPDGGPMPAIRDWAQRESDCYSWELPVGHERQPEAYAIQRAALKWVADQAVDEVLHEVVR